MTRYLTHISGPIPNTLKEINIDLNGRNLIISGANGCGKTSFLKALFRKFDLLIVEKQYFELDYIRSTLLRKQKELLNYENGTIDHKYASNAISEMASRLKEITEGLQLKISNPSNFSIKIDEKAAVIKLFDATRTAKITHADSARGIETARVDYYKNKNDIANPGNNLEQHLLNLRNRRSLAMTEDKNEELAKKISLWFEHFEANLKILMEDQSTELVFNSDTLKFSICQTGKPPYNFQTLSSGYMAIFDIYADLLMRVEYTNTTPEELCGLVIIDEIDAHLHVSLQRLILPFLSKAFPQIQFVVTTHSPFVLMSVNDAVIFDISRNEQIDGDLSLYSYSAVIEGLLGTKPSSKLLDTVIEEIATIAASTAENRDYGRLEELIGKIENNGAKLDSRYKAFYKLGVSALLDKGDE